MTEIETKFLLTTEKEEEVRNSIMFEPEIYQLTVMYDKDNELFDIDARLRLRKTGNEVTLDYKKPLTKSGIKKELEYTAHITSFDEMENILTLLGYTPISSYEKYRSLHHGKDYEIMIDRYPFATYIEIEGNEQIIVSLAKTLGFDMKDNITSSCDDLYADYMKSLGKIPKEHILFCDFD